MDAWGITTLCIISVCAAAFIVLVVYLLVTLSSLNKLLNYFKEKIHVMDPFLHVVDNVGHNIDQESKIIEELAKCFGCKGGKLEGVMDIIKWCVISAALFQKFRKKR